MFYNNIILKNKILAGHCTWKINPENMRVALGKYYSDINKKQAFTQIRNIEQIIVQPLYQDQAGNYGSDLAILVMQKSVVLSQFIRPICIDWELHDMSHHLQEGNEGLVS